MLTHQAISDKSEKKVNQMVDNGMRATLANDVKLPVEIKAAIAGLLRPYKMDLDDLLTPKVTAPMQRMLSLKAACEYCGGISKDTIRRAILASEITSYKLNPKNGRVLVEVANLDHWLNSKQQQTKRSQ